MAVFIAHQVLFCFNCTYKTTQSSPLLATLKYGDRAIDGNT